VPSVEQREKTPDAELLAGYAQLSSISTHAYNSRQPEPIHKSSYIRIHPNTSETPTYTHSSI
jgi:hypothetical protein